MNPLLLKYLWIPIIIFALFFIGGMIYTCITQFKKWNNGICPHCKKCNWSSFVTDSGGSTGYICNNCNEHIWINYNFITKKFIKYDIKYVRKQKLKKLC